MFQSLNMLSHNVTFPAFKT